MLAGPAIRQPASRPGPGTGRRHKGALDSFTPVKSLGLGAAMSVYPQYLALTDAEVMSIAQTAGPAARILVAAMAKAIQAG